MGFNFNANGFSIDCSDEMDRVIVRTYEVGGDKIWIPALYSADHPSGRYDPMYRLKRQGDLSA